MISIIFTLIGFCIIALVASWCYSFIKWCWKNKLEATPADSDEATEATDDDDWTTETLDATLQSMAEEQTVALIAQDSDLKSLFNSINKAVNAAAKK